MRNLSENYSKIKVHLGAHRTGTSNLQACLYSLRAELADMDYDLHVPSLPGKRFLGEHRRLMNKMVRLARQSECGTLLKRVYLSRQFGKSLKAYCQLGESHPNLLISDENILGDAMLPSRPGEIYPDSCQRLAAFSKVAGPKVDDLFIAIRPYSDFLTSYVAMSLVYGKKWIKLEDIERWSQDITHGWHTIVGSLAKTFPSAKITVWLHETINVEERLSQLSGVRVRSKRTGESSKSVTKNASPSLQAIRIVEEMGDDLSKSDLDSIVWEYANADIPRSPMYLSGDSIDALKRAYERDVCLIREMSSTRLHII